MVKESEEEEELLERSLKKTMATPGGKMRDGKSEEASEEASIG